VTTPEPVDEAALAAAVEAAKAEHEANMSRYVCGPEPIYLGGARAFNPGDPVPVSHVTAGVVDPSQVVEAQPDSPAPEQPAAAVPDASPVVPAAVEEN
jgi:hypothetical protein